MTHYHVLHWLRWCSAGGVSVCAAIGAVASFATDFYQLSAEDVLSGADLVVVARILDRESLNRENGTHCGFVYKLKIDEVLFGKLQDHQDEHITVYIGPGTAYRPDQRARYFVVATDKPANDNAKDPYRCENDHSKYFSTTSPQGFLELGKLRNSTLAGEWVLEARESVLRALRLVRLVRNVRSDGEYLEAYFLPDLRDRVRIEIEELQQD